MWTFLKAEVTFPILGVDFLRANRLSMSVATNQLVYDSTGDTFPLVEQPSGHTASIMLQPPQPLRFTFNRRCRPRWGGAARHGGTGLHRGCPRRVPGRPQPEGRPAAYVS